MASSTLKIAAIPGDGTGPEVTAEALKVLDAVSKLDGFTYDVEMLDWGGERYLKTGEIIPEAGTVIAQDGAREIRTPHDDCLLIMPTPVAPRGHTAVRLARFLAA